MTSTTTTPDATGGVPDADSNPELVSDRDALLEARDILAGDATLNWADNTSIATWDGVTLGGTPQRVTQLNLQNKGLTGTIPVQLSRLTSLTSLHLADNALTGCIPTGLRDVEVNDLETLNLPDCHPFDFNGDGEVDIADFFLLIGAFSTAAPTPALTSMAAVRSISLTFAYLAMPLSRRHRPSWWRWLRIKLGCPMAPSCSKTLPIRSTIRRFFPTSYRNRVQYAWRFSR